jgi:acetylornithine deacetylase
MAAGLDTALRRRIRAALDRGAALDLLKRAVGTPSVTGSEADFARLLEAELSKLNASDLALEEFLPSRPNLRGVLYGTGAEGRSLLVMGHLDTVHVRGWHDRWKGTDRADPFGAAVVEGALWGRGAADLKAGICAALMGLGTLDRAGLRLAGDVTLAFIGDEESGEPDTGVSAGVKALIPWLASLSRPSLGIYVEPSGLDVFTAQIGFLIADITVLGRSAYFGLPEAGVDALKATHEILAALWDHAAELNALPAHPLLGRPSLLVTSITGGGYIAVPGECRLSLIRKLLPGEDLGVAAAAIEAAARTAPSNPAIRVEVAFPAGRDHAVGGMACETDAASEGVALLCTEAAAAAPGPGRVAGAPFWSEASFLMRLGIPAVYFAPGDIRCAHTTEERVSVAEYLSGIEALACFMAAYCGTV